VYEGASLEGLIVEIEGEGVELERSICLSHLKESFTVHFVELKVRWQIIARVVPERGVERC
jgi:hypothetical protein